MRGEVIARTREKKVIAIARGIYGGTCRRLVQALLDGGVGMIEFTFDQSDPSAWERTCENISMVCRDYRTEMICGAGTVMSREQVCLARSAGAEFIVSPNVNRGVIEQTVQLGMVSMPGALTPTEIANAALWGADFVKIFPAADLGPGYIRAVRSPLNHIPLLAVGGVNENNIGDFIRAGAVGAGIGGNLVNRKWIEAGEFEKITQAARLTIRNCTEDRTE